MGVGVFIYSRIRKRNAGGSVSTVPDLLTQKQLDQRAGSLLVQLDDSLKTSEQEFDDAEANSAADQRAWTTQIIQLCEAADLELDAQADAFDELRQLEKNAPKELAEVRAATLAANDRVSTAAASLKALQNRYAPTAVKPVAENLDQATKLLAFAGAAADKATAAKALPKDATSSSLDSAIAAAEQALNAASAAKGDPLASLTQIEKSNASLDELFSGVRDQQQKTSHARAQLDPSIIAARAQITSAMEDITTRRGGIGSTARTRVSEADRHLAQATALAASDPIAALDEAQQASSLAAGALDYARQDVAGYEARENISAQERSQYNGVDGADLGGILGGWLTGGSGSGGSASGGLFGGSGGSSRSSSSGGGSRSSRSGSFGGSSRSSSRSSGGRSGRGGRF